IELFMLGYSPSGRDELKNTLIKQGIEENSLIEVGLLAKSDDGKTYDRFRDRLIFPIRDAKGKFVAFGGRILPSSPNQNLAKYLNSPETPIFHKGEMLFAFDIASKNLKNNEELIVAEGYIDVIALHQAGFTNAVAPLGTAITDKQLQLLWRYSPEPILCLDGDSAGKRAMKRAAMLALPLIKPGISLKFVSLPAGEDPDSVIKKSGSFVMKEYLQNAKILSQVLFENALSEFGYQTPEKKAALENNLMQTAENISDNIIKQHVKDYFRNQLFSLKTNYKAKKIATEIIPPSPPEVDNYSAHILPLEEKLLTIIILCPEILHESGIEENFAHLDFTQGLLDKIREIILDTISFTQDIGHASLCDVIKKHGFGEKLEQLLNAKLLSNKDCDAKIYKTAFLQSYQAYNYKKLDQEIMKMVGIFETDTSPASENRLTALKKQKEELLKSHYSSFSE
ncbi:MAG: toprim domain-containing protein, partial [Pseudomonadota bacterium]